MRASNGNLHPASSDGASDGTPSEEHPEFVDINVVLPNGTIKAITVEYGKQMMDLLVQVAAGNRLSPASHTIHITNEETGRTLDYKASQSIGSLKISTIQLVPRKVDKPNKPKSAQPFVKTQRLTVNLPRNQKFVTRVSPKSTLAEIYNMVCEEKNMDVYKYELRHPTHPDQALNMASPLEAYGLSEIVVINVGAAESRRPADYIPDTRDLESVRAAATMPRMKKGSSTASGGGEEGAAAPYMPGQDGTRKKKKGMFSFLNKNKKAGSFKLAEATYNEPTYAQQQQMLQQQQQQQHHQHQRHEVEHGEATSPSPSSDALSNDSRASGGHSPVPQNVPTQNRMLPKKRRAAPAPPPPLASVGAAAPASPPPVGASAQTAPAAPPPVGAAAPAAPPPVEAAAPTPRVEEEEAAPITEMGATSSTMRTTSTITTTSTTDVPLSVPVTVEVVQSAPPMLTSQSLPQVHSRNSSHSSGFDESNISPLESPGAPGKVNVSERTQVTVEATTVQSVETQDKQMKKSQSMPIKTNEALSTQIAKSSSLSTFNKRKKRKAPAPPPPVGAVKPSVPKPIDESSIPVESISSAQEEVISVVTTSTEVITLTDGQQVVTHTTVETEPISETIKHVTEEITDTPPVIEIVPVSLPEGKDEMQDIQAEQETVDISKDVDDYRSSSGSLERPRPRLCQFVPPPPPTSPPPPDTPVSPDRAKSFELIARGVEVTDSSIQVHVSSPRSEEGKTEFLLPSAASANVTTTSHETDSVSENSSIDVYVVNEVLNGDTSESEEEMLLFPCDPSGVILVNKVYLDQTDSLPALVNPDVESIDEHIKVESARLASPQAEVGVTSVTHGGEPDIAGASDSGHSTATLDKSGDIGIELAEPLPFEHEITFDDKEVLYVEPLKPGNTVAKDEYHIQVERDRQVSHGNDSTPLNLPEYVSPMSTSTPMVASGLSGTLEDSLLSAHAPSPVEVSGPRRDRIATLSDTDDDAFVNDDPRVALKDYHVVGLVKDEVMDFSYAKNSKPIHLSKKEEPESMVTSLRQKYTRRPVAPREPLDLPDLETMGLVPPGQNLPPPPSGPAPPPPNEPASLKETLVYEEKESVFIPPPPLSFTDHEATAEVIEVIEPQEQELELSIPNEAEPETLERERRKKITIVESPTSSKKPVGILKRSSSSRDSDSEDYRKHSQDSFYSSSPPPTTSVTARRAVRSSATLPSDDRRRHKRVEVSTEPQSMPSLVSENASKPQGILKSSYESSSSRVYSSNSDLDQTQDKGGSVKERKPMVMNNRRSLGVYGPRPWGATRPKSESNILEGINLPFTSKYSEEKEVVHTKDNDSVRQRMTEIGFAPGTEREKETVLEEKSLTLMERNRNQYMVQEPTKTFSRSEDFGDDNETKKTLQKQYEDLQQQFSKWQKQLMDNQALLSKKKITDQEEGSVLHTMPVPEPVKSKYSDFAPQKRVEVVSSAPLRKQADFRYEHKVKATLDYGGGGKFNTNDLLSAKSRLRSNGDDVEEKNGIELGKVVECTSDGTPIRELNSFQVPYTPPPPMTDFPAAPRRVVIEPLVSNPSPKPIGGVRSRFEPKLDPREELMIAIRNNGGRNILRTVTVGETRWAQGD